MFEARLIQGSVLKKVLYCLVGLLNEAIWDVRDSGLELQAIDPGHNAAVSVNLGVDGFFDRFRLDRKLSMGMNLNSMSKILRGAADDDKINIIVPEHSETVTFLFENKNKNKVSKYDLKLMDLEKGYKMPEADYPVAIKMPSGEFARIVRDLSQIGFGETIVISCTKEGVKFSAKGDIVVGNIKLTETANVYKREEAVTIEMHEPVTQTFNSTYLSKFTKATPLATQVSLSMSPDGPLVVEYKIGDMGHVRYYLPPQDTDN